MPRLCLVCSHPERAEIDRCLVDSVSFRIVSKRFNVSVASIQRHNKDHVPTHVAKARDAREVADADDLLVQIQDLRKKSLALLARAEQAGDFRTALAGVKEARSCIEVLLEIEGKLDRRPSFSVTLSPQWVSMRTVIIGALRDHPEAAQAVAAALKEGEGGNSHAAD
ncbi:MAG: hypothetical protein ACR2OE_13225 [Thermomicrobiales bacterium]